VKKLTIKFLNIEESPICSNFKVITPDEKLESSWSSSKIGRHHTKEMMTSVHFDYIHRPTKRIPTISFLSKMEDIMNSSIQICIWKDNRIISDNEKIRTVITKNQSTGVQVEDVDVTFENSEDSKSESSESAYISAFDSNNDRSSDETPVHEHMSEEISTPDYSDEYESQSQSEPSTNTNQSIIRNNRHQLLGE
jgi:hypothetical protein